MNKNATRNFEGNHKQVILPWKNHSSYFQLWGKREGVKTKKKYMESSIAGCLLISEGFGWSSLLSLSLFHQDLLSLGLVLAAQLPQLEIGLNVAQLSIENIFNIEKNICFPTQGKLISFLPWPLNWIPFIDFEFKEAQSQISYHLKCQECTISFLENVRRYVFGLC